MGTAAGGGGSAEQDHHHGIDPNRAVWGCRLESFASAVTDWSRCCSAHFGRGDAWLGSSEVVSPFVVSAPEPDERERTFCARWSPSPAWTSTTAPPPQPYLQDRRHRLVAGSVVFEEDLEFSTCPAAFARATPALGISWQELGQARRTLLPMQHDAAENLQKRAPHSEGLPRPLPGEARLCEVG